MKRVGTVLLVVAVVGGVASAQEMKAAWSDGLKFSSEDKAFVVRVGGRILTDVAIAGDVAGAAAEEGTEVRAARLTLTGLINGNVEFKAEYDFAAAGNEGSKKTVEYVDPEGNAKTVSAVTKADEVSIKDLYVGITGLPVGTLRIGHLYEPMFIDNMTSTKYMTFLEAVLPVDAFSPVRNTGVLLSQTALAGGAMTCEAGVFKDTADGQRQGKGGWSCGGRVTGEAWRSGANVVQVGASVSLRDALDDTVSHKPRPEHHLLPSLVGASVPASGERLYGVESAAALGSAHVTAEYLAAVVDTRRPAGPDANLSGYYVQLGYFVTGESRPLKEGTWQRVRPARSFGKGSGAVELKARYSTVDLSDAAFQGGSEDNIGLGANWYLNPNTILLLDVTRIRATKADGGDVGGTVGALRCQVDF